MICLRGTETKLTTDRTAHASTCGKTRDRSVCAAHAHGTPTASPDKERLGLSGAEEHSGKDKPSQLLNSINYPEFK